MIDIMEALKQSLMISKKPATSATEITSELPPPEIVWRSARSRAKALRVERYFSAPAEARIWAIRASLARVRCGVIPSIRSINIS